MELKDVLFDVQDGVGVMTMNRPERLNANSPDMARSMIGILSDLTPDVRAIVLTGAGRAFCAGGDVKKMGSDLDDPDVGQHGRGITQKDMWRRLFGIVTDQL